MSKYNVKVPFNANSTMLLADMNKEGLRAACKFNGVKGYGNMTNDGMRDALIAKVAAANAEQGIGAEGSDGRPRPILDPVKTAATIAMVATVQKQLDPVAKAQLDSYLEKTKDAPAPKVVETPVVDVGPREKVTGTVVKPKSLKIEKGRIKQNGVTQPSTGSICRAIWDALDAKRTETKAVPTFENLRDMMKQFSWSRNTAMTQYQRWKQFNGVMPRTAEAEAGADETVTDGTDDDSQDE